MTKREFLREYREYIDSYVESHHKLSGAKKPSNDDERWDWVQNDEPLYRLAQSRGVQIP